MSNFLTERETKIFKSNIVSGLFDGTIFGLCWGAVYGPVALYKPDITSLQYKRSIYKYMGTSILKGAPLVAMARCVGDICESKEVGVVGQGVITFALAIGYLTLVKFP